MKTFNRVLALLLAVIMTVAVLPLSVLADKWVEVEANTNQSGNVTESDVTVSVDPAALLAYLKNRDLSGLLKGATVSGLREAFSLEELYGIVPENVWRDILSTVMGEINLDQLLTTADADELLKHIDVKALSALVTAVSNLEQYVADFDTLMSYISDLEPAIPYINKTKLLNENASALMALVFALDDKTLIDLVNVKSFAALPGINLGELANLDYIANLGHDTGAAPYEVLLESYVVLENVGSQYFDTDKLEALVGGLSASSVSADYVDVDALKAYAEGLDPAVLADYLVGGEVSIDLVLHGDSVAGIAPLFTLDWLVTNGYVDVMLAVQGDTDAGIPALVTIPELLAADAVYVEKMIEDGVVDLDTLGANEGYENIAKIDKVKAAALAYADKTLLIGCLKDNTGTAAVKTIGISKVVNAVGGYTYLINNYVTDFSGMLSALGFETVLRDLVAGGALTSVIYVKDLVTAIGVRELLATVNVRGLASYLYHSGLLKKVLTSIDYKKVLTSFAPVLSEVTQNVKGITLNGTAVASEDSLGTLSFDAAALLGALADIIPTLDELAAIGDDGVILELQAGITYSSDVTGNVAKTKKINLTVVLESGVDTVRKAAKKLSDLIGRFLTYTYADGKLTLGVSVPAQVSSMLRVMLEKLDTLSPELQDAILALYDGDADDLIAFVNNLTLDQIVELFEHVSADDFRKLYDRVLSVNYVQIALDYIETATGRDLSGITPEDIIVKSATLPTLREIAELVEDKLGVDILSKLPLDGALDATVVEIFEKLAAKAGVDVDLQGILTEAAAAADPVQALYDIFLARLAASDDVYAALKSRVISVADRILASGFGRQLAGVRLCDIYENNGVFQAAGTLTVNPKALIEKGLNAFITRLPASTGVEKLDQIYVPLVNMLKSETADKALALLLAYFGDGSLSLDVDATVTVNGLYSISFYDEKGDLLFTTFLPEGTDLSKIFAAPDNGSFVFTGWADKNDPDVLYTHMPKADVEVVAVGDFYYTVTLVDGDGAILLTIPNVKAGTLLNVYEDALKAQVTLPVDPLYTYVHAWKVQTAAGWADIALDTPVTSDLTLKCDFVVDPTQTALRIDGVDHTVTDDGNGNYTVTVDALPDAFELLVEKDFIQHVIDEDGSITVTTADGKFEVSMDTATLQKLMDMMGTDEAVRLGYKELNPGTLYPVASNAFAFEMGFFFGEDTAETPVDLTGCDLTVTMPFGATVESVDVKTFVSVEAENTLGYEDIAATVDVVNKTVTFTAPHFSEYAIVNKYNLTLNNNYKLDTATGLVDQTISAAIANSPIAPGYYAAGEELAIGAVTLNDVSGQFVAADHTWVKTLFTATTGNGELTAAGTNFTMPAAAVTLTHVVKSRAPLIFYYGLDGKLQEVVTYVDGLALKAPGEGCSWFGYSAADWGKKDMYLFLKKDASSVVYTIELYLKKTDTAPNKTYSGSAAELRKLLDTIPSVSSLAPVAGKAGKWVDAEGKALETYDWNTVLSGASKTVKFYAEYTDPTYTVTTGGNVTVDVTGPVAAGTTVKVTFPIQTGIHVYQLTVKNLSTGVETPLTPALNGAKYEASFTMPAADVLVSLEINAGTLAYVDANGNTVTGTVGDIGTFTVTVPVGYTLTKNVSEIDGVPATATLISSALDADGNMLLTYQWTLSAPGIDIRAALSAINACIKQLGYQVNYILNGKVYGSEREAATALIAEDVILKGWKSMPGNLMFAILEHKAPEASLLALWIVLGILLFVLIVAVLYILYINGKLKPNFILRFVVWLVSGFYAVCKAVAVAGLFIARLFGYREEDLAKPDDTEIVYVPTEKAEEPAEEAADEAATEETAPVAEVAVAGAVAAEVIEDSATEEATEEAPTEEAAEEVTEETPAEEATEEVTEETSAEEATEEVTEEAPAEEAVEEVTEEIPAEEAVEEVTEETPAEEAVEEVTEEAPAEETAEDEAPDKKND